MGGQFFSPPLPHTHPLHVLCVNVDFLCLCSHVYPDQNMNTVLDDNMMLCLANGERIKLKPDMRMLFEVRAPPIQATRPLPCPCQPSIRVMLVHCHFSSPNVVVFPFCFWCGQVQDLEVASPATVSRLGVVFMTPDNLGWLPYVTTWLEQSFPPAMPVEVKVGATALSHLGDLLVGVL